LIYRNPSQIHEPLANYTHQIEIDRPVKWLVLSGQIGRHVDGTVSTDPIKQIDVAFENLYNNLRAANMNIDNIVKLTCYLVGKIDTVKRRNVFIKWLKEHQPCMTLVYVAALAAPNYLVEIDAWACDEV
jgi:enamine deaminase RidA (YjgF/YER057c/UK114 family)